MHLLFTPLLAQTVNPGGTNWLSVFTQNITDLVTQNGDALSQFGMILLTFIGTIKLIGYGVRLSPWSLGGSSVSFEELKVFLFRFLFCCVIEHYWVTNLPGAPFGINRMFGYMSQVIAQALDQGSLDQITKAINTAAQSTTTPSVLAWSEVICYWIVQIFMGFAAAIIFMVNCSGFIFYAVCALFGPLIVPLYLTEHFRGRFIHYIEVLCSFAMIRAVGAAFIFVWSGFLVTFLNNTFQGNYSPAMWAANFIPFLTVFICFILNMVMVPMITQIIFGGSSGSAGKVGEIAEKTIIYRSF